MGKSQSKQNFLEHRRDPLYGEVLLYLDNIVVAQVSRVISNEADIDEIHRTLLLREKISHPGVLKISDLHREEISDLCTSFSVFKFRVEYHSLNLIQETIDRRTHGTTFSEMELLYIISSLVEIMTQITVLDIHPSLVLIADDRTLRYYDSALSREALDNYAKVVSGQRDVEFLSPEQCQCLELRQKDVSIREPVNVFCLAMMIVCIASGRQGKDFYTNVSLDLNKLVTVFKRQSEKYHYSSILHDLVIQMLDKDKFLRPNIKEIQNILQQARDQGYVANALDPPGFQPMLLESQVSMRSASVVYQPDFTEVDKKIAQVRKKAQMHIDHSGLNLQLAMYDKQREFRLY